MSYYPVSAIHDWLVSASMVQHVTVQQCLLLLVANNHSKSKTHTNKWIIRNFAAEYNSDVLDQNITTALIAIADYSQETIVNLADFVWGEIKEGALQQ
jgi:hypothetical protein